MLRNVLLPVEPTVFGFVKGIAPQGHQCPVFFLANFVHTYVHLFHDVKLVKNYFVSTKWQGFKHGQHLGLPHVHRNGINGTQLLRGAGLEKPIQARFFPIFRDEFHSAFVTVIDNRQVPMTFAESFFIHSQKPGRNRLLPQHAPVIGTIHRIPGLVSTDV